MFSYSIKNILDRFWKKQLLVFGTNKSVEKENAKPFLSFLAWYFFLMVYIKLGIKYFTNVPAFMYNIISVTSIDLSNVDFNFIGVCEYQY